MNTFDEYEEQEIEYNPLDEVLEQATAALLAAAKGNVAQMVAELKRENAFLKNENSRLSTELMRALSRSRELSDKEDELNRMAAQMPIDKFFGQRSVIMYKPSHARLGRPDKCDKCNDDRNIWFLTPLGKQAYEACECSGYLYGYQPNEMILTELRKDNRKLLMWFKPYERDEHGYTSGDFVEDTAVYKPGDDFAKLDKYKAYFRDLADCQAYCDRLNNPPAPAV